MGKHPRRSLTELGTASAGPARGRASGLRRGLRRLRARGRATATRRQRQKWAVQQMLWSAKASKHLGLTVATSASPARSPGPISIPGRSARPGLIETAFDELAKRWRPIFDAFDEAGCSVCLRAASRARTCSTASPSRCSSSGWTTIRAAASTTTPRTSSCSSSTISSSSTSITSGSRSLHIKDAEFRPDRAAGRLLGLPAVAAAGRAVPLARRRPDRLRRRSSRRWPQYGYDSWAVLEWECCLKHPEAGAAEGAEFIKQHIIRVTEKAFDDFAGAQGRSEAGPADARPLSGSGAMTIERRASAAAATRPAHPARHGRRRRGRLHRRACTASRRGSTTTTSSSPARSSSTPTKAKRSGLALGLADDRCYADYAAMAQARSGARRRHRGRRHRHAEPPARAGRPRRS